MLCEASHQREATVHLTKRAELGTEKSLARLSSSSVKSADYFQIAGYFRIGGTSRTASQTNQHLQDEK